MMDLYDRLALKRTEELLAFTPYIARREEYWLIHFLMDLHDDFEGLYGGILHRNPLPCIDSVVSELLVKEMF